MDDKMNIQWYPGHMTKTRRKMEEDLKLVKDRHPVLGWPFIRGVINFLDSLIKGVKALMWSAEFYPEEEEAEPSRFEKWLEQHFGTEALMKWVIGVAVAAGIAFAVALFAASIAAAKIKKSR